MSSDPKVVLVDFGCGISQAELLRTAEALTIQAQQHFGQPRPAGWGIGATVRGDAELPRPDEWVLGLFAATDQPNALGYHDIGPAGLPQMKVFPPLDAADGVKWSVTASHELLETLIDWQCNLAAQDTSGAFWALEVADPVERDSYGIGTSDSNEVLVSNFVLPTYFGTGSGKLDFLGLCKTPFGLRPGGYAQKFDPASGWTLIQTSQIREFRRSVKGRSGKRLGQ